jgi:hypothetical protein
VGQFVVGANNHAASAVHYDRPRMVTAGGLIGMFVLGGTVGALGFKYVGFVCVVPLAVMLLALSLPPLFRDVPRSPVLSRLLGRMGRRQPVRTTRKPHADSESRGP